MEIVLNKDLHRKQKLYRRELDEKDKLDTESAEV